LNHTDVNDTQRLRTLTQLARVLLQAVGTPPTFLIHQDRGEPSAASDHLLRLSSPLAPDVEAVLAAEPPAAAGTHPPPLPRHHIRPPPPRTPRLPPPGRPPPPQAPLSLQGRGWGRGRRNRP